VSPIVESDERELVLFGLGCSVGVQCSEAVNCCVLTAKPMPHTAM
jgi:hypothetical protein